MASTAPHSVTAQHDATAQPSAAAQHGRIRPQSNYTEEKLRPAVAASQTMSEVLARLGLADSPKRRIYASARIKALGIDASHLRNTGIFYTDEQITDAVATSKTMVEVALKLGAKPMGGTLHHLRYRVNRLSLDTSHFARPQPRRPPKPRPTSEGFRRVGRNLVVNEEMLRKAVPRAKSLSEVVRHLGLEPSERRCHVVREEIRRLGLDTEHMLGQAHFRGTRGRRRVPIDQVLAFKPEQQRRLQGSVIKHALLELGVPDRCAMCGTGPQWQGLPMSLEVDHINGDFRDNRRENLRLLCPNCHATTNTYCRKKRQQTT